MSSYEKQALDANIIVVCAQIILIVLLTKISSLLEFVNLYFTFQSLFFGTESAVSPGAVFIKLVIPILAGFLVIALSIIFLHYIRPDKLKAFRLSNIQLSTQVGGFFAAILLAWPMIVHWDALAHRAVANKYDLFMFIYGLYAVTFFFLSGVGALLADRLFFPESRPSRGDRFDWRKVGIEAGLSTACAAIATFVMSELGIA